MEDEHINIGAIELDIIELNNDNDEEEKSTDYMEENINKREYDEEDYNKIEIEAKLIADKIHTLMGKGDEKCFYVYDKKTDSYRSVQYKDIVILLRTTKDWSDIIRNELEAAGIPSYADTGTGYFDTVEIKTIMSFCR